MVQMVNMEKSKESKESGKTKFTEAHISKKERMKCSHTGLAHTCKVFRESSCCGRAPPTVTYCATHLCHNSVVIQSAVIIYSMYIILNEGDPHRFTGLLDIQLIFRKIKKTS